MSFEIIWEPAAAREARALPKTELQRVLQKIEALTSNPRSLGSIKLSGAVGLWRIRVGDYRVLYQIIDKRLIVVVVRIAHRREAYRHM
jgi:mRNA interferase RelE/StbE